MADRSFDQLDEIADEFECRLDRNEEPRIEEYLAGVSDDNQRRAALRELIEIELEYGLRRNANLALAEPDCLLVDGYVRRFPLLARSADVTRQLVVAEYRARHRFGDAPRMDMFVDRFPRCKLIKQQLRQVLIRMLKAQLRVYEKTTLLLVTPFDQEMHVGRQRSTDREPHQRVNESDRARLLIAPIDDRSVSRQHLVLERIGRKKLDIQNVSRSAKVTTNAQQKIECGESCELDMPLLLYVGSRMIRIETIESERG